MLEIKSIQLKPLTRVFWVLAVCCSLLDPSILKGQQKRNETWTIVVYHDKNESPGNDWKESKSTIDQVVAKVSKNLPIKGDASVTASRIANEMVDEQIYASLLHALSGTLLKEDKSKERQEWLIQFSSPPPQSLAMTILGTNETKVFNRANSTFQPTADVLPKLYYAKAKPRIFSGWTIRCDKAPVLQSTLVKTDTECSSHVAAKVLCADGEELPVKVCLKSRFNDNFINRILPVRLELKNLDDEVRTKLLSAFGPETLQPNVGGIGSPKEPMLFVPINEATNPSVVAISLVFVVEQQADPFFYSFVKSKSLDSSGKMPNIGNIKWYKCEASNFAQYKKSLPRSETPAPILESALFKEASIRADDPLENVILIGKSGGKLSLRVSEFADGKRSKLGDELANDSKLDTKWLNDVFEYASKNAVNQ